MTENNSNIVIAALYKFVELEDYILIKEKLVKICLENEIKGTLLLAQEGINGTVSGTREAIDNLNAFFQSDLRFNNLEYKESLASFKPFLRMKVKLKKEIVALKVAGLNPSKSVGTYVAPKDWNALISNKDTILIDTRNTYETDIGTFKGAVIPKTTNFRDLPQYVNNNLLHYKSEPNKKIAMFCTGGIRCEKSTAYLVSLGFKQDQVFHLKGGILNYLQEVSPENSTFHGECFVFDERIALDHELSKGHYKQCHGCRHPVSDEDQQSEKYKEGVHCPHCFDTIPEKTMQRAAERHKQIQLAHKRNQKHLGAELQQKTTIVPS